MRKLIQVSMMTCACALLPLSAVASCADADSQPGKGFKCGYLDSEVPETWSAVYNGPDIVPMRAPRITWYSKDSSYVSITDNKPFYSVAQRMVAYGDMNWSQLDFYYTSGRNVDRTVALLKRYPKSTGIVRWTTDTVAGKPTVVAEYGLDNGEVTKGGSGGKVYFLTWPFTNEGHTYRAGLIIVKQALGDVAFEQGVQRVLGSLSSDRLAWLEVPHKQLLVK
jgi:hypothetical protein